MATQKLIESVIENLPEEGNAVVIVPSHRFRLFLASELAKQGKRVQYIFQLPELVDRLSEKVSLANDHLLIQVAFYEFLTKKEIWKDESAKLPLTKRFIIISQLIKDINEILLNLPLDEDPYQIFDNIAKFYRTGIEFNDKESIEEYLKILKSIWRVENLEKASKDKSLEFIARLWEVAKEFFLDGKITKYTKDIWKVPIVTEGILLREEAKRNTLHEQILKKLNNPQKIIIVGFGALDRIYFEIFKQLKERLGEKAVFIWQTGKWLDDIHKYVFLVRESNNEISRNRTGELSLVNQIKRLDEGTSKCIESDLQASVYVHLVPNRASQIGLLAKMISDSEDELKLILLLQKDLGHLLWHSFKEINLSMGLPLNFTPVKSFLSLLDELYGLIKNKAEFIPIDHYTKWKDHPIGTFALENSEIEPTKTLFVDKSVWKQQVVQFLESSGNEAINLFFELIQMLDDELSSKPTHNISRASLQQLAIITHHLEVILRRISHLDAKQLIQLLKSMLFNQQVVLKGEPLYGLQAMEILETRGLYFDEVFIPDVSESTLPPSERMVSMIPLSLRIFYGLPTPEVLSFRYYYNFYRLLTSTKKAVHIICPSNMDGQPAQKSIVLDQIPALFKNCKVKYITYVPNITFSTQDADLSFISDMLETADLQSLFKELRVTDFSTLLQCPRKFLLSKLIPKEIEEPYDLIGTDARLIGDLVHNALAKIYKEHDIKQIKKLIEDNRELTKVLLKTFEELISKEDVNQLSQIPSFAISKEYLRKILERDNRLINAGEIESIEHECDVSYSVSDSEVIIKGRIDRIEKRKSSIRIVDFKHNISDNSTNITKDSHCDRIEKIMSALNNSKNLSDIQLGDFKATKQYAVQVLMYEMIYREEKGITDDKTRGYIYSMARLSEPFADFEFEVDISKKHAKSISKQEVFEKLKELGIKVYETVQNASKTEELTRTFFPVFNKHCDYCQFKHICFNLEQKE